MNKIQSQHSLSNPVKLPSNTPYKLTPSNKPVANTMHTIQQPIDGMPGMNEPTNPELKTKDQLIEKIKEWVKIDNEIRVLQKEQRKRLADKKKVSGELMAVMRSNDIDAFDLNDGQILYEKRNTKKRNARKRNTKKRNTKKRNTKKRNTKKRNPKNRK